MNDKTDIANKQNHEEWPNAVRNRDELDSALEAGLKSGVSSRTTEEIFEGAIARLKNG